MFWAHTLFFFNVSGINVPMGCKTMDEMMIPGYSCSLIRNLQEVKSGVGGWLLLAKYPLGLHPAHRTTCSYSPSQYLQLH